MAQRRPRNLLGTSKVLTMSPKVIKHFPVATEELMEIGLRLDLNGC